MPILLLSAACGGKEEGEATPAPTATSAVIPAETAIPTEVPPAVREYWAGIEELITNLVPQASRFSFRVSQLTRPEGAMVEVVAQAAFADGAEARLHIVRDPNPMATPFSTIDGFELYKSDDTLWAKLEDGDPPLWVGVPGEKGLKAYLQFYVSGDPPLTNDRFWKAFSYAKARISQALGTDVSYLWVDFHDQWNPPGHKAGGMRVQAGSQERTAYVGVLYSEGDPELGFSNLVVALGSSFKQRFALPDAPLQETEAREWGFANHIWYAEWETEQ